MSRRPFTITKLARSDEGYWTARVSSNGYAVEVDRKYGSWQTSTKPRREVLPHVAAALQEKVRERS